MSLNSISYDPTHSVPKKDSLSSDIFIIHHATKSVKTFVDNVYILTDKHCGRLQDSGNQLKNLIQRKIIESLEMLEKSGISGDFALFINILMEVA